MPPVSPGASKGDLETTAAGATTSGRFGITFPTSSTASAQSNATLFFTEDGASFSPVTNSSGASASHYRADVCFGARDFTSGPVPVHILVTWPALANSRIQQWPSQFVGNYEIVTMLNR